MKVPKIVQKYNQTCIECNNGQKRGIYILTLQNVKSCIWARKNQHKEYFMKIEKEKQRLNPCEEKKKDLGITFDPNLSFNKHISNITKKANQMLGIIKRTFTFMNKNICGGP